MEILHDQDVLSALAFSFQPRLPVLGAKVCFGESFLGSAETMESIKLIEELNANRVDLERVMHGNSISLEELQHSIEAYLPNLFLITWSLKSQSDVMLTKQLYFEWKGSVTTDPGTTTFPVFAFEIAMTLHTLAMLHVIRAHKKLEDDLRANLSVAGREFLAAASILDYLATSLLPRWVARVGDVRPPEVQPALCLALALFYQAQAQKCAALKAALSSQSSTSSVALIAKVCVSVADLARAALSTIENSTTNKLPDLLLAEINYTRDIFLSLSCFAEAVSQKSKDNAGVAIYFFNKSLALLQQKRDLGSAKAPGLPKLVGAFSPTARGVERLAQVVREQCEASERENRLIFFQPVPGEAAMPVGALVMSKPEYAEPRKGEYISFRETKAIAMAVPQSEVKEGSETHKEIERANTNLPLSENKQEKSDYEVAKELQDKINRGMDV